MARPPLTRLPPPMPTPYADDLAYVHDTGYGEPARAAARLLLDTLHRDGISSGLVVDLGCGSGILAEAMTAAGYDVVGVDLSPDMIDIARRRAPRARFHIGSLLDFPLPPCIAACAVGEILSYLLDDRLGPAALPDLLRRIHAALLPGGVFLGDVATPDRVPPPGRSRGFREGPDWAVLVEAEEAGRILTRHITTFRKVGDLYRRSRETHRQHLVAPEEMTGWLRDAGFDTTAAAYGEQGTLPGQFVFLGRKPRCPPPASMGALPPGV